jgi:hypothetical protein
MNVQSFVSMYRVYFVSVDNILKCICELYILYKIDGLGFIVYSYRGIKHRLVIAYHSITCRTRRE